MYPYGPGTKIDKYLSGTCRYILVDIGICYMKPVMLKITGRGIFVQHIISGHQLRKLKLGAVS